MSLNDATSYPSGGVSLSANLYPDLCLMEGADAWWSTNGPQNAQGGGQGFLEEEYGEFEKMMSWTDCAETPGGLLPEEGCGEFEQMRKWAYSTEAREGWMYI